MKSLLCRFGPFVLAILLTASSAMAQNAASPRPMAADEVRGRGRHQVQFDAAGLPSGMYFYRFKTDAFSQTRQLVVVR